MPLLMLSKHFLKNNLTVEHFLGLIDLLVSFKFKYFTVTISISTTGQMITGVNK